MIHQTKHLDRFKAQHPNCVLLFRVGDFYEAIGDDAITLSRVLGLTLTTRRSDNVNLAGVPAVSVETYLRRLIEAGHRVAICESKMDKQMQLFNATA